MIPPFVRSGIHRIDKSRHSADADVFSIHKIKLMAISFDAIFVLFKHLLGQSNLFVAMSRCQCEHPFEWTGNKYIKFRLVTWLQRVLTEGKAVLDE